MGTLSTALAGMTRSGRDRTYAAGHMPRATRELTVEGTRGWLYPVTTTGGDLYQLFAWFDGSVYQVRVIRPDLWNRLDLHASHLFRDARICFGPGGGGTRSLPEAFALSVAWANGFSAYQGTFAVDGPRPEGDVPCPTSA